MGIAENLQAVRQSLPQGVRLVAVSKFHPVEVLQEAYDAGQRLFGESRVQELVAKHEALPDDIEWHFIGHLQTNKIKYMIPFVHMIHAVDSLKLLKEIGREAEKHGREKPVLCLLQIHVAREETKYGFTFDECRAMLESGAWKELPPQVRLAGVMAMASNVDDVSQIRAEFHSVAAFFQEIKSEFFADDPEFRELSMGMSHDYPIAVEEHSTLVRVGTRIFGEREYR